MRPGRAIALRGLTAVSLTALCAIAFCTRHAFAGGGPQAALVIIDPTDADSMYLGNYYVAARQIPWRNVVYLAQDAADYADLLNRHIEGLLGELSNRRLTGRIHYVILASGTVYRVDASGYVTEEDCTALDQFSVSSAYGLAHQANEIISGQSDQAFGLTSTEPNGYWSTTDSAVALLGDVGWVGGNSSAALSASRYFIGAMLGYTGPRGNTPGEIVAMIDRGVAADGTEPAGTFYYMKTTDVARSSPRDPFFPAAITSITGLGGQAVQIDAVLPDGNHDCLGIMTGWANPAVTSADLTIEAGAFCDHLTSWAATFDKSSQTKVSAWIATGASGSHGTVEEPCAVAGKFPHPRVHVYYYQGLSLGEAVLRSLEYLPFQGLLYGDPLTQPFAILPAVDVPDAPTGVVSQTIVLTPQVSTAKPGAGIAKIDLLVDGDFRASIAPGQSFGLGTTAMADGAHELRVVATDDSLVANQGQWVQWITTDNDGRWVTLDVQPATGDLATTYSFDLAASGPDVAEIRVKHNGRVVAATRNASDVLLIGGATLGGGPVRLVAEAEFTDGTLAVSDVATVGIDFGGACCLSDGTCRQVSASRCQQDGAAATYFGDGTSCQSGPCSSCGTGDFDTNGAVDLGDVARFLECFAGPGALPADNPPGRQAQCLCAFDFENDSDVDLVDYTAFHGRLTGPRPAWVNSPPVVFSYTKDLTGHEPAIVELPATDYDGDPLAYTILTPPAQATVVGSGPTVVLRPNPLATGTDTLQFEVGDAQYLSAPATVTLRYPAAVPTLLSVKVSTVGEPGVPIGYSPADHAGRSGQTTPLEAWFANDGSTLTLTAPDPHKVSPFVQWVVDGDVQSSGQTQVTVPAGESSTAVAVYLSRRQQSFRANRPSVFLTIFPNDDLGQGGGTTPMDRFYLTGTQNVIAIAPSSAGGLALRYWKLDGVAQGADQTALVTPLMDTGHLAVAIYADIPGDWEDDGDVDAVDAAAFQRCFSGDVSEPGFDPPSQACLSGFDISLPADGDVDLEDFAEVFGSLTGPF